MLDSLIGGYFNPQGPRGPRLLTSSTLSSCWRFQSTRPSRASTASRQWTGLVLQDFNPQGPRGPRPCPASPSLASHRFQSTRPSRASTLMTFFTIMLTEISIHKALAGLDLKAPGLKMTTTYFNPQGPRGPRRCWVLRCRYALTISIHKALAGLDG